MIEGGRGGEGGRNISKPEVRAYLDTTIIMTTILF